MSTDWEKYATAQETLERGQQSVDNYAVLSLITGEVRAIPGQRVQHTPVQNHPQYPDNRAHTDVFGVKNTEARAKFLLIYQWVIPLGRGA